MGPYVGILLSRAVLHRCLRGQSTYESPELYDQFGKQSGHQPVFFSLDHISFEDVTVQSYIRNGKGQYEGRRIPLPAVIHNRIKPLYSDSLLLERLRQVSGTTLFNRDNRMDKWKVYQALHPDPVLRRHLPETAQLTPDAIHAFLTRHRSVYVKPCNKSLAMGILRLDTDDSGQEVCVSTPRRHMFKQRYTPEELSRALPKWTAGTRYLVQQALPLLQMEDRLVDIRVAVQRGLKGTWDVSGMVARVGLPRGIATNVAVGGRACSLQPLLEEAGIKEPLKVGERIQDIVLRAANVLNQTDPGLADLGFDVAVSPSGQIWIIEVNGRDIRVTFRQAQDLDAWRATFRKPMEFAAYLLKRERAKPEVAVLTPGTLPLSGESGGSVETVVRETAERVAESKPVAVLGKGIPPLNRPVPVEIRADSRRKYLREALGQLRRLQPRIIQVENRPMFVPEVLRVCPRSRVVLFMHSDRFLRPPHIGREKLRPCIRACDRVMTNSAYLRDELSKWFPSMSHKIVSVPLGVDLNRFRPIQDDSVQHQRRERRSSLGLRGKKVILYVGRILPQKGLHFLLSAFPEIQKRHPNAHLMIVGGSHYGKKRDTPYVQKLKKIMDPFREQITWIPFVSHDQVSTFYRAADLLVMPSVEREAFGLVNLEGMASGLPVISVRIGGIPEVIEDGVSGMLLSPGNLKEELSDACSTLLDNPARMRELSVAARRRVEEHFSWKHVARRLNEQYDRLLRPAETEASTG